MNCDRVPHLCMREVDMTAQNKGSTVTLLAGADVGLVIKRVDPFADLIVCVIQQENIRFGQCECRMGIGSISSQVQGGRG